MNNTFEERANSAGQGGDMPPAFNEILAEFNSNTAENCADYNRAKAAGFHPHWFVDRIRRKAMMQGFLPQNGYLVFHPRYDQTAPGIFDDLCRSMGCAQEPLASPGRGIRPWQIQDVEAWRQTLCTLSVAMFNLGVIAACTPGDGMLYDPVMEDGIFCLTGDVGISGLPEKTMRFVRAIGGDDAVQVLCEIGNDACVNMFWDRLNTEKAFGESPQLMEAYCRNACAAAYIAGACFAGRLAELAGTVPRFEP